MRTVVARPIRAILFCCLVLSAGLGAAAPSARAQVPGGFSEAGRELQYRGPTALYDPEDPMQSLQWTLGFTLPGSQRLRMARTPLAQKTDYDLRQQHILPFYH